MGKQYEVLTGVNYPSGSGNKEKRAEPGEIVDDLPAKSIDDLLAIGAIREPLTAAEKKKEAATDG